MHYKLIESDKYDLRLQVCNVVEKANNLNRTLANEWPDLDGYQLNAFDNLVGEMEELVSMIEHIKSRRKAA
jgi:protein-tyrosine phosphatase